MFRALTALFTRPREEGRAAPPAASPPPPPAPPAPAEPDPVSPLRLRGQPSPESVHHGLLLTTASPASAGHGGSPVAADATACEGFEADLRMLLNLAGGTLTRALRPALGVKGQDNPAGPVSQGLELAERIAQKARGRLLETSLTPAEEPYLTRVVQNAQDAAVALRTARYAWQIGVLLTGQPGGVGVNARLKRLTAGVLEMNGRVVGVLDGQEEAKVVAAQYRAFLELRSEVTASLAGEFSLATRLGRAALWSLTLCAESVARIAARASLPDVPAHGIAPFAAPPRR